MQTSAGYTELRPQGFEKVLCGTVGMAKPDIGLARLFAETPGVFFWRGTDVFA
jgi:hypothetical protein